MKLNEHEEEFEDILNENVTEDNVAEPNVTEIVSEEIVNVNVNVNDVNESFLNSIDECVHQFCSKLKIYVRMYALFVRSHQIFVRQNTRPFIFCLRKYNA